jgi:hypothetical protein
MLGKYRVAAQLVASRVVLSSTELVRNRRVSSQFAYKDSRMLLAVCALRTRYMHTNQWQYTDSNSD